MDFVIGDADLRVSGNKGTADARKAGGAALHVDAPQGDSNGRENGHMKNGRKCLTQFFRRIELQSHSTEAKIEHASRFAGSISHDSIGASSRKRDALGAAMLRRRLCRRGR